MKIIKNKRLLIIILAVLVVIVTISYAIFKKPKDNYNPNSTMWNLNINYIDNKINDLNLKIGSKVDIFISDSNINNEEFNNAYIKNAEIKHFRTSNYEITNSLSNASFIEFGIPYQYLAWSEIIPSYSTVTLTIKKSDNEQENTEVNNTIYEILKNTYELK